jgi:hypothetical protein
MLSNILLSMLSSYIDEIIGDHQCGFRRNRSTTDQIFCFRQILEKKWEYKETVHQLFMDFKKAYDSVKRDVLYNILIEFRVPRFIKMCLIALEYAIMKVQEKQVRLKLNGTHQLLAYAVDVNLLGDNIDTIKKNKETLIYASKEVGLEINIEKTNYIYMGVELCL